MTSKLILSPETIAALRQPHAILDAAEAATVAARNVVSDVRARRAALALRLTEHDAEKPDGAGDTATDLSEALARDPAALDGKDWKDRLRTNNAAATQRLAEWEGERTIIAQAIARLDAELVEHGDKFEAAGRAQAAAWQAFVNVGREVVLAEYERRLVEFYDVVGSVHDAFARARDVEGKLTLSHAPNSAGIHRFVSPESAIYVNARVNGNGGMGSTRIYPPQDAVLRPLSDVRDLLRQSTTKGKPSQA